MARRPSDEILRGMSAAQGFRLEHKLGIDPISDLWDVIRSLDVDLAFSHFPAGADGLYNWDGHRALIVVNTAVGDIAKQRFTAAHELGHHLLHGGEANQPLEVVDEDIYAKDSEIEKEADAFAAYVLAPDEAMRAAWPGKDRRSLTVEDVAELMHRFGISFQAAVFRLHNAGRINAEDRDRLLTQAKGQIRRIMRAKGYEREALMPGDALPGWYVLQVVDMARAGTIDLERAAELLRRDAEAVRDLIQDDGMGDDGADVLLRDLLGGDFDALLHHEEGDAQ